MSLLNIGNKSKGYIDASTLSRQVIDYAHHEIHGGTHYVSFVADSAMVTNDTLSISFVTPATPLEIHAVFFANTNMLARFLVLEAPTSANGSAHVALNRNRNSSNTHSLSNLLKAVDTPSAWGTTILNEEIGANGVGGKSSGGQSRSGSEFILKYSTKYHLYFLALADGGAVMGVDFYEHTPKVVE